ncbi:glycosyltransferase [Blastococcus saxobsidens]|uniref:MGT family glycosyltransferase n=1 Tax=Blastococcus saxobsidens TaxID=138336 RepID=A0A4Q7Y6G2_9ACTN|nr:glycosyltransferase [Blastococcus saxobsidens]RZU31743.1 MGT family glycosyltransferase [Blastococcus saxobsidens]
MRYLVALWDGGGTVPVEVGVVRRLVARGHRVTVLGDPTLAPDVAAAGAEFRSWTRAPHRMSQALEDDVIKDWECRTPVALLNRLCERIITGPAAAYAADVRAALADQPADALIASGPVLGALVGAESMGVPTVALCANAYSRPAPGIPPFGSGLAPARGPLGRARDRAVNALAGALWNRNLPPLNAARTELGLDPLREIWEQWDRAARVLVLTSPAFDLPATLPDNVRYVGPVLDDPAWSEPVEVPRGDEPLVIAGLSSTYMRQADVLRRIVAALDTLAVRGVVTTGPAIDPAEIRGTAKIAVVRSAPHAQLFPAADVVVTHAGHGTLIKGLAAGVPTLCLPMGRDQGDNVVRAARHGAVIGLKPTAGPQQIATAVRRLLDDPSYRRNAEALGARLRADASSTALLDELERLRRDDAPRGRLTSA